jgi:sortase B
MTASSIMKRSIPMKKHKEKIKIGIVIGVFSVVIISCLVSIFSQVFTEYKENESFKNLAEIVTEESTGNDTEKEQFINPNLLKVSDSDDEFQTEQPVYYTTYYEPHSISELISMNSECFGWISIAGTNINYPVMHTPSNPQKYLNKNFYGEYSYSGTPFLDSRCFADSTNLIIYGHHMNNGTMFADLCNYTDYSYFTEHPIVVLETKDGVFAYSVFSVMKIKSDDDWYKFTTVGMEKSYKTRIEYAKEKSIYNTEITPVCGQQILTLSTCYGYNQDDRILVLAVQN